MVSLSSLDKGPNAPVASGGANHLCERKHRSSQGLTQTVSHSLFWAALGGSHWERIADWAGHMGSHAMSI